MEHPHPTQPKTDAERLALAARYREIGISAVAAALCFTDDKPVEVAGTSQIDSRFVEAA